MKFISDFSKFNLLETFDSTLEYPKKITRKEYKDLELVEYDEYGGIIKTSPIPRSDFRRLAETINQNNYLISLDQLLTIQSYKFGPIHKTFQIYIQVIYFEPIDDYPYYLIHTIENEKDPIKEYYMAETFDGVINFCRMKLK